MVEKISGEEFTRADGVAEWRVLESGQVGTTFRTGSFDRGVALVVRIGELADAADHHPDVDLRYPSVTVRLSTHEVDGLSERDVALAREITAAAAELGIEAEPSGPVVE
ncbi:4a-hydroxytetrahydrobiopterin dehydratase [Nocardioides silvaticus]|uniref:Putative pterin-4-alpha-carbinolamine dehydratase n=1 Tax=Nocardioides silvaticus TaxID=2201891 RepID=A0A316TJP7_9ACTN|nr:4a-hydroxytetrahydrobiopterin dehydratase [Nocardioides silvaticus]PWN02494.1 4a-hydroxytetrahydrobiopterin dehydratase [Nocardioides silvaticus]